MQILKKPARDLKRGDRFSYVGGFGTYMAVSNADRCEQISTKVVLVADREPRNDETKPRRLRLRLDMGESVLVVVSNG